MITYYPELRPYARKLRNEMTRYERTVWYKIRCKQIHGIQFYRQKTVGRYIIDFYAKTIKLAIEIDGSQHYIDAGRAKDVIRDDYLHSQGITILRFGNHEVYQCLDSVIQKIKDIVLFLASPAAL